ncbi:Peptidase family M23 [Streptomyces sp. DfronAA-171]|nr:Peptidase family M23 [Streptomyces sp. DfronAA-171]
MSGRAKSIRDPGSPREVYGTATLPGDGDIRNGPVIHRSPESGAGRLARTSRFTHGEQLSVTERSAVAPARRFDLHRERRGSLMATTPEASLRARSLLRLGTAVLAAASATLAASLAAWAATWAAQESLESATHTCTASRAPATTPPATQSPPGTRSAGCPPRRRPRKRPPASTRTTIARTTTTRTTGTTGSRMTGPHRTSGTSVRKSTGSGGSGGGTRASGLAQRPPRSPAPPTPATPDPASPDPTARSWPVSAPPPVLRGWEPPATPYGPGHRGVDLGASEGTVVRAAAAGQVVFAGPVGGRGVVSVELPGTGSPPLRTTYEPVVASVRKGDVVRAGQPLGVLSGAGAYHCGTPCLHWGLRRGKTYLNPLSLLPPELLGLGPSRLFPPRGPLPQAPASGSSADPAAHPLLPTPTHRRVARPASARQPVSPPPSQPPVLAPEARPHDVTSHDEDAQGRPAQRERRVSSRSLRAERGRRPRRRSSPAPRRPRVRSGARRHRRHLGGASPRGAAPRGRDR